MAVTSDLFWSDLEEDLGDPEFLRAYIVESVRIATIDRLVNELDDLRQAAGMSKAALARAIGAQPSVVRRLLSSPDASPTVGTLAEVAAALGMRVALVPLNDAEIRQMTQPLRAGTGDTKQIARGLVAMRERKGA